MIEINVIGLGFVGLTTAIGFANKDITVNAIEKDSSKLKLIKNNIIPFYEPELKKNLIYSRKKKKINFSDKIFLKKNKNNIFFICIGTPAKSDGSTNFKPICDFLKDIKNKIKNEKALFVIKSTVPPNSIKNIFKKIFSKSKNIKFCSNPEFLREGHAWKDFFNSGKIVIGHDDEKTKKIMTIIYRDFKDKKIFVNNTTAEFIKYLSNSMLGNMISFSNEMTILAEKIKNIDVKSAFNSLKIDNRWNGSPSSMRNYYHPGLGYGGYCLPKDIKSFKSFSKKYLKKTILDRIDNTNNRIFNHQLNKILKLNKNLNIFVLGLSFKPGSDDLRSSQSIKLVKELIKKKRRVMAFDPKSFINAKKIFKDKINIQKRPFKKKNTIYVLSTAWPEYINFLKKVDRKNIIDLRYVI